MGSLAYRGFFFILEGFVVPFLSYSRLLGLSHRHGCSVNFFGVFSRYLIVDGLHHYVSNSWLFSFSMSNVLSISSSIFSPQTLWLYSHKFSGYF